MDGGLSPARAVRKWFSATTQLLPPRTEAGWRLAGGDSARVTGPQFITAAETRPAAAAAPATWLSHLFTRAAPPSALVLRRSARVRGGPTDRPEG